MKAEKAEMKRLNDKIDRLDRILETMINMCNAKMNDAKAAPTKPKKSDKLTVKESSNPVFYRYLRPVNNDGEIDSQRGVTLRIELDYTRREIKFSYAICNHSNGEPSFSKQEGRKLADSRKRYKIPLWEEPGPLIGRDITDFIVDSINENNIIPAGDRRHIVAHYFG